MNKEVYRNMGTGSRIFFLIALAFAGMFLAGVITLVIISTTGEKDINLVSINVLKLLQTVQEVCIFLLPALIIVYLFEESPRKYLTIDSSFSIIQFFLIIGIMIVVQPFINWLGEINSQVALPEALKSAEESAGKLTERFLSDKSIFGFSSALFVVAAVAAVCEEFFFRGVLQQLLQKLTSNIHLAVWIGAIVFSAIHFQFYGFLPRMILGALLGYIFAWTRSIWTSVLAHFTNNALAVIFSYMYAGTATYHELEKLGTNQSFGFAIGSFIVTLCFMIILHQTSKTAQE